MFRTLVLSSLLIIGMISTVMTGLAQSPATPETTGSFIGDWTLSAQGDQGPAQFALTLKIDAGKVVGTVRMGEQAPQPITDISLNGKTLVLKYLFDYQGTQIDAVISMTPAGDKVGLEIAFAGGAYIMSGTAEKKKPAL